MPHTRIHHQTMATIGLTALMALMALTAPAAQAATLTVQVQRADGSVAGDTVVQVTPVGAWTPPDAGAPVVLNQKDMRFEPYVVAVPMGGTLRLTNQDRYDHHVRSMAGGPLGNVPPAKTFEVRLPGFAKGALSTADVKMDGSAGTITLGCHIHGSMRGHVYVSASPWVAVSDDRGQVVLQGVPEGAVDLKVWHPDQLLDTPAQRLQVSGDQSATARLNFNPRKRRTPPPVDHYSH